MNILIICNSYERLYFYNRIDYGENNVIFLTNKIGIYLFCIRNKIKCFMSKSVFNHNFSNLISLSNTLEVKLNLLSNYQANLYYRSFYKSISYVNDKYEIDIIFTWNGSGVLGKVVTDFCLKRQKLKAFFEISNLPGKMLIDPIGVNAQSYIYNKLNYLDKYEDINDEIFRDWVKNYKTIKSKVGVPQANKIKKVNYFGLLDILFLKLTLRPSHDSRTLNVRCKEKVKLKKINLEFQNDNFTFENTDYVFLPLQVCNDSQIKLNSKVDNVMAIQFALNYAKKNNLILILKLHPAETNLEFVEYVKSLNDGDENIYLTSKDSLYLIDKSSELIVINSTIGLEAKILGKKVTVLGNAIYKKLSWEQLKKYVFNYLIDIDYFSNEKISYHFLNEIIKRAKINE